MLTGLALWLVCAPLVPVDAGTPTGALDVEVVLGHDRGNVWVLLFDQPEAFPVHRDRARGRQDVRPVGGRVHVSFEALPPGAYAVAVVHDENDNGKLDTRIFGIPKEGLGASNDARGRFGPPSFEAARVLVGAERLKVTVQVVY